MSPSASRSRHRVSLTPALTDHALSVRAVRSRLSRRSRRTRELKRFSMYSRQQRPPCQVRRRCSPPKSDAYTRHPGQPARNVLIHPPGAPPQPHRRYCLPRYPHIEIAVRDVPATTRTTCRFHVVVALCLSTTRPKPHFCDLMAMISATSHATAFFQTLVATGPATTLRNRRNARVVAIPEMAESLEICHFTRIASTTSRTSIATTSSESFFRTLVAADSAAESVRPHAAPHIPLPETLYNDPKRHVGERCGGGNGSKSLVSQRKSATPVGVALFAGGDAGN